MWSILLYPLLALASYALCDFFLVEKSPRQETDYTRVKRIFSNVRRINQGAHASSTPLWITGKSLLQTAHTIINYKRRRWIDWYYTPEKLGENHMALPYYYNGSWYKAILPKPEENISRVISISSGPNDITSLMKGYIGPDGNFGNIPVSPAMFGHESLTIKFMAPSGVKEVTFRQQEIIDLQPALQ